MRKSMSIVFALTLLSGIAISTAQDADPKPQMPEMPEMPTPQQEHEWLRQLVGEWDTVSEMTMGPDQPPLKGEGREQSRMIGGFWATFEHNGEAMGTPFTGILTLGYDPQQKRYVGTWIDSMSNHMWQYVGSVSADGKRLTLETEGPCPSSPDGKGKFRETIEIVDADHKTFTSQLELNGEWVTILRMTCTRRK